MGKADLHIHTIYSDGTCTVPAVLEEAAYHKKLNVIAITDHDKIEGAWEAAELAPRYGIEAIVGSEISTAEGHLVALFLKEAVAPGLSLVETVQRVGAQGGLCIAPHPMAYGLGADGLSAESLKRALAVPGVREVLVGLETYNASLVIPGGNARALMLNQTLRLAAVGSSDSHTVWALGQGSTVFRGRTAKDLRQALLKRSTHARRHGKFSIPWVIWDYLSSTALRAAGWVTANHGPHTHFSLQKLAEVRPYLTA